MGNAATAEKIMVRGALYPYAPISDASPRRPRREAPEFLQKPFAQEKRAQGMRRILVVTVIRRFKVLSARSG